MSKWCGDENCLQCADKEPDPYVHLPRADYEALREQNRVLLKALRVAVFLDGPDTVRPEFERWSALVDEGLMKNFNEWYAAQVIAALTATSQSGGEHEL